MSSFIECSTGSCMENSLSCVPSFPRKKLHLRKRKKEGKKTIKISPRFLSLLRRGDHGKDWKRKEMCLFVFLSLFLSALDLAAHQQPFRCTYTRSWRCTPSGVHTPEAGIEESNVTAIVLFFLWKQDMRAIFNRKGCVEKVSLNTWFLFLSGFSNLDTPLFLTHVVRGHEGTFPPLKESLKKRPRHSILSHLLKFRMHACTPLSAAETFTVVKIEASHHSRVGISLSEV